MVETVFLTYVNTCCTDQCGSKFYTRNVVGEEKWSDLMTLFTRQDGFNHIVLHDDDISATVWEKWLSNDIDLQSLRFENTLTNVSKLYSIFVMKEV